MKPPIFMRPLTDAERAAVAAGLRSVDSYTLRRCPIIHASAAGRPVPRIAATRGCHEQTVRHALHAFDDDGVDALSKRSARAPTIQVAFSPEQAARLRELRHHRPREVGHPTPLWTLELAAQAAHAHGLTEAPVTGETVRATRARLGVRWLRAKRWLTSPDPAYARNKANATGCAA